MHGFDNSELKEGLCNTCSCKDFAPSVTYALSGTNLTLTEASTYDTGDTLSAVHFVVTDRNGKELTATVTAAGGNHVFDISTLDKVDIDVKAFVVSRGGCKADLSVYGLGGVPASGTLGNVNEQGDNVNPGNN